MFGLFLSLLVGGAVASPLQPTALRCEYLTNPLGIDVARPRLSWKLVSNRRGALQTAYQIEVADSEAALKSDHGSLWDSGKVASDRSIQVVYNGKALPSGQRAWWRVRVWDGDGKRSGWSAPGLWEMGLLSPGDWKARWIGSTAASAAAPYLRKTFQAAKTVKRARLYATALGLYELYLNGKRVGSDFFRPGWTDYHQRVQYQTYDVTGMLTPGSNALGMVLGDGWYCGYVGFGQRRSHYGTQPSGLAQLHVDYSDGTSQTVVTDDTWKANTGPILISDMLMGETYDARKELTGWATAGYDDAAWGRAEARATPELKQPPNTRPHPADTFPGGVTLVAQPDISVRQVDTRKPVRITEKPAGAYVFDLGQNMVGWVRLKVEGPAGTTVTLRFAEMLNSDGSIYTTNLRSARATDRYTLKGGGKEVYEPSFTFHGFRYVEVTGYPGKPNTDAVTGIVVSSVVTTTGTFACSNPMVNQLQHNIFWGQRGNYLEVPTDCPQRDERLGWMGDAQVFVRTGCFNADIAAFMNKWMNDVEDAQSADGGFSDVSPRLVDPADGAPAWGDAGIIVPWTIYACYGDTRIIARHYAAMAKWIDYIHKANPNLLWRNRGNNNFGDWLSIRADTPRDVLATAYFAYDAHLMAQMAHVIGREDDARKYADLFSGIKEAFNRAYVGPEGRIKGDTQTCYVLALRFGLLPEEKRSSAAGYLVADIERRGGHLSTGFVGVGYLTPTLTKVGHPDVAYRLLNNDTFPSWGYSIKHGATTIWERWDGWTAEKGFQDPGMNSFNHYSLGSVGEWMYSTVAGIDLDPDHPGYKHILLHPRPGGGLTYARASYDSMYGKIVSDWRIDHGTYHYKVEVPANTTATVSIPTRDSATVMENAHPADRAEGVRFLRMQDGCAVYEVGSGIYSFSADERR
jgi:alpha-L-rhamnosidase